MIKLILSFAIAVMLSAMLIARQADALQEIRIHSAALESCFCDLLIWDLGEASRQQLNALVMDWFELLYAIIASITAAVLLLIFIVLSHYIHLAYDLYEVQHGRR